jgi:hypothetical protein
VVACRVVVCYACAYGVRFPAGTFPHVRDRVKGSETMKAERLGEEIARDVLADAVRDHLDEVAAVVVARVADVEYPYTDEDREQMRRICDDWWAISETAGEWLHERVDGCADVIYTGRAADVVVENIGEAEEALEEYGHEWGDSMTLGQAMSVAAFALIHREASHTLALLGEEIENEAAEETDDEGTE